MNTILIYGLKVTLSLALFYAAHMLLLRRETFFKIRRAYFLFALAFSLLFPFIYIKGIAYNEMAIISHYVLDTVLVGGGVGESGRFPLDIWTALIAVSIVVSGVLLIRLVIQFVSAITLFRKQKSVRDGDYKLIYVADDKIPTCSFFRWLIINTKDTSKEQQADMLTHEKVHISQNHSIDVLLYEMLCTLFWWNPFTWLLRYEMKLNLEYLADAGVQALKEDLREYQYLLLKINTANTGVAIINNFNVSQLKKRIIMMNKKRSSLLSSIKYLVAIPMAFLLVCCNSEGDNVNLADTKADKLESMPMTPLEPAQSVPLTNLENSIFTTVDVMPEYKGGTDALVKFIGDNLKYPETAKTNKIGGRVIIRFVVSKTGEVKDVEMIQGIDPDCDAEALRVVSAMPKWKQGEQGGKPVDVYFTLPILFKM